MVLFAIDTVVVIIAAMAFGLQAGLFALVSLFISTKAMDAIIKGFNTAMQFLIISTKQEEIVSRIHSEVERGCTRLEATGTYEGRNNGALLCVVSRMEAAKLKKIVSEVDPHAFVTVCEHWARDSPTSIRKSDFSARRLTPLICGCEMKKAFANEWL